MVANLLSADLLVILSVVDGLLTGDPGLPESKLIPIVERFTTNVSWNLPSGEQRARVDTGDEKQVGSRPHGDRRRHAGDHRARQARPRAG